MLTAGAYNTEDPLIYGLGYIDHNCDVICNNHGVMSGLMYLPISVVGHFAGHFGSHIGITGDQYLCKWFLLLYLVGNSVKHIRKYHKCEFMLILNVLIAVFVYKSDMFRSHIGGHIGFRGDLYIENSFWCLHWLGHGQKHIHRHLNCDFICNIHGVKSVLMYYWLVSSAILVAILAAIFELRGTNTFANDCYCFLLWDIVKTYT
jgi:hypothetical protein